MEKIYLDNAATTPVLEEVIDVMVQSMKSDYGNPSSTHQFGRSAKSAIENARKSIASNLSCNSSELIFTSGGTEANNLILTNAVLNLGVKHIVTSKLEHHAVLNTVVELNQEQGVKISYVKNDSFGLVDLVDLKNIIANTSEKTLVSLMFVNNEIGTVLPVGEVAKLCKENEVYFHTDAVQAVGHLPVDLTNQSVDFLSASGHKFHGPKGVGFAYFKKGFGVKPQIYGGAQEKGARAGTESVHSIMGMSLALSKACENLNDDCDRISKLKSYFISELTKNTSIHFNGVSSDLKKSTPTILNIRLNKEYPMLLFQLDLKGIAVSGGSACQSGSNQGSHVLNEILSITDADKTSLRFSFSKFTKKEEIDYTVSVLKDLIKV